MDDNIGNFPQYNIAGDPNVVYCSTKIASKSVLQALSILLCEGNDIVQT